MERNTNDTFGNQNSGESTSGGFGAASGSTNAGGYGAGSTGSTGGAGDTGSTSGTSGYGATSGASGYGSTGGGASSGAGSTGGVGGSDGFSRDTGTDAGGLKDRARNAASTAGEKLSDFGSQAKDRASELGSQAKERASGLKATLADALESGAERLRQQGAGGGQIAGAAATGGSTGMVSEDNRLAQTSNQLAGGLQAGADWLRDADLEGVKSGIEKQVKEHPGRTLAVAVGLGYLLGKALRK